MYAEGPGGMVAARDMEEAACQKRPIMCQKRPITGEAGAATGWWMASMFSLGLFSFSTRSLLAL
jgi:hypothetical protein